MSDDAAGMISVPIDRLAEAQEHVWFLRQYLADLKPAILQSRERVWVDVGVAQRLVQCAESWCALTEALWDAERRKSH